MEASLIRQALARAGGNHTQAAKLLGVSRNGLAMKMERLGIKD
jgi:transcriptional regulator with PAS, ATPase and Fis domain